MSQSSEDLVGKNQEFSMQRRARSTSLVRLACMEIDRLFRHFINEFPQFNDTDLQTSIDQTTDAKKNVFVSKLEDLSFYHLSFMQC